MGENRGYNLAQCLYSRDVPELVESVASFLESGEESDHQGQLRKRIRDEFSSEAICDRLLASVNGETCVPPPDLAGASIPLDYHVENWERRGCIQVPVNAAHSLSLGSRRMVAGLFLRSLTGPDGCRVPLRRVAALLSFVLGLRR